jgi:hypothetical protein
MPVSYAITHTLQRPVLEVGKGPDINFRLIPRGMFLSSLRNFTFPPKVKKPPQNQAYALILQKHTFLMMPMIPWPHS